LSRSEPVEVESARRAAVFVYEARERLCAENDVRARHPRGWRGPPASAGCRAAGVTEHP